MIEDAVPIEEDGRAPQSLIQFDIRAREILGYADIDEISAVGSSAHGAGGGKRRENVLLERGGQRAGAVDDRPVEHIDAGIDRTGRALARCNEGSNPIALEQDPAVAVADDVGAQGHVNKAGVGARDQIEDIEVEE